MNKEDTARILKRIQKCLALSKSPNEHEAAAAFRQARKLMERHNLSEADIDAANIQERRVLARVASRPALWEAKLAFICAEAFRCQVLFLRDKPKGLWIFVGMMRDLQVCEYAFRTLLRQILQARSEYTKTVLTCSCRRTLVRRADMYCTGFVEALSKVVQEVAGDNLYKAAISTYLGSTYIKGKKCTPTNRLDRAHANDYFAGSKVGKDAHLFRPMEHVDRGQAAA